MNREQELLLDGIASRSREDSVTLRLRNFDLAPFTQVIERMGYVFEGRTNGSATMKSALHAGEITADICSTAFRSTTYPHRRCASPRAGISCATVRRYRHRPP